MVGITGERMATGMSAGGVTARVGTTLESVKEQLVGPDRTPDQVLPLGEGAVQDKYELSDKRTAFVTRDAAGQISAVQVDFRAPTGRPILDFLLGTKGRLAAFGEGGVVNRVDLRVPGTKVEGHRRDHEIQYDATLRDADGNGTPEELRVQRDVTIIEPRSAPPKATVSQWPTMSPWQVKLQPSEYAERDPAQTGAVQEATGDTATKARIAEHLVY